MSLLKKQKAAVELNSGMKVKIIKNICQNVFNFFSPSKPNLSKCSSQKNLTSQTNKTAASQSNKSISPIIKRSSSSRCIIPVNIPIKKNALQEQHKNLQRERQKKQNIKRNQLKKLKFDLQKQKRKILQQKKKNFQQSQLQNSLQKIVSKNKNQIQKMTIITCCLTDEIMENPFNLPCGHCFEEQPIKLWFQKNSQCPICHRQFSVQDLRPNFLCKIIIEQKIQRKLSKSRQKYGSQKKILYRKEEQIIKIGEAVFKNIPKHTKKIIQSQQQILKILKKNQWNLNYKKYSKMNWQNIFPYMQQCQTSKLFFSRNFRPQIIQQIQNVSYANLKEIFLSQNNINSIEPLASINFKRLIYLDLGNNNIVQIKCFKKLLIPTLKKIRLYQNPLVDLQNFTNLFHGTQNQLVIQQDLTDIVKTVNKQKQFILLITLNDQTRIKQEKTQSILRSNFPQIKFSL